MKKLCIPRTAVLCCRHALISIVNCNLKDLTLFSCLQGLLTSYRSPTFRAAFPFGHGLTFTSFEYSGPHRLDKDCGAAVCVAVLVKNVGQRSGEELVQAYVHFADPVGGDEPWLTCSAHAQLVI
ncbi:bglB [Symbiodinium sp. CCMP2456]|nr:bglB [Symbiodinium sp. CCMP2456]